MAPMPALLMTRRISPVPLFVTTNLATELGMNVA